MVAAVGGSKANLLGNLNQADKEKQTYLERLSSGKRINKAQDDAAGLAIVAALEAESSVLNQAIRNNQDSVSALSIAEGAAGQVTDISTRMKELAMQSANGVLSDAQREPLAAEFNALRQEIDRISATTEFNGKKLLQGEDFTAQIGGDSSANSQITVGGIDVSGLSSQIAALDISTAAGAQAALQPLQLFSSTVASARGDVGAVTARLQAAEENTRASLVNNEEAASRIRDVDIADTTAKLVSANIRGQAGVALQAHQNQSAARVLDLLK